MYRLFVTLITAFQVLLITQFATAQKLPNKQETSVWLPDYVKIDGKSTEWNNKFQAYNHATEIFYTIANNDKTLYLIVQATDYQVINRIFGGGITLTILKPDKNDKSVTYPFFLDRGLIFNLGGGKKKGIVIQDDTSFKAMDSAMTRNNKLSDQKCKWIKLTGIKGMDTLSVYNEQEIKARGSFDIKKAYTFEWSVPLKDLGLLTPDADNQNQNGNETAKFKYHLQVNGTRMAVVLTLTPGPDTSPQQAAAFEKMNSQQNVYAGRMTQPTDFTGEYTLAKAP